MATPESSKVAADILIEKVAELPPTRRPMPLFLDVDGVINAYARSHGSDLPGDDWTYSRRFATSAERRVQYKMFFAPDMIRVLNALIAAGQIEPYWLTTWWETANSKLIQKFGLDGPFATLEDDRTDPSFFGWKLTHVRAMLEADPSMVAIWIDDDITQEGRAATYAKARSDRLLTVSPKGHHGITAAQLSEIIDWIAEHPVP